MLDIIKGRRTQVVKGEVCKTSMQRFESARRLHFSLPCPNPARIGPTVERILRTLKLDKGL